MMSVNDKQRARELAVATARRVLDGHISALQGARDLLPLLFTLSLDYDEISVTFRAVDSQTDHLPLGGPGSTWSPQTLTDSDPDIQSAESFHRDNVLAACQSLIKFLEPISYQIAA